MKKWAIFLLAGCLLAGQGQAVRVVTCTAKRTDTDFADFGKMAMPLAALGVSLAKQDWYGAVFSQVLANGLYPLNNKFEHKIGKKRPCGCPGAFPSGHMIMWASGSSYLHYRYGWEYGLPAYIATALFAADRVDNKAHSWGDMLGTFLIINAFTYLVTPAYEEEVVIFMEEGPADVHANLAYLSYAEKLQPVVTPVAGVNQNRFMAGLKVKM